jgi:hypothetical protein
MPWFLRDFWPTIPTLKCDVTSPAKDICRPHRSRLTRFKNDFDLCFGYSVKVTPTGYNRRANVTTSALSSITEKWAPKQKRQEK